MNKLFLRLLKCHCASSMFCNKEDVKHSQRNKQPVEIKAGGDVGEILTFRLSWVT